MKEGYTIIEQMNLPSNFHALVDVENLVERICTKLETQEEVFGNVLIAVTEAVTNSIVHGNKEKIELTVQLAVGDSPADFCFVVKDFGEGFNYNDLPDPTAPENILKENGRGIFLMKNLADEVVYNHKGNEVSIYFSK